jgi:hypothetical protein
MLRQILHPDFFTLVDVQSPGLGNFEHSEHLRGFPAPLVRVVSEAAHAACAVVILDVYRVPESFITFERLPLVDDSLQIGQYPLLGHKLCVVGQTTISLLQLKQTRPIAALLVDVHDFELNHHLQLVILR